jgi:hypothetical protein
MFENVEEQTSRFAVDQILFFERCAGNRGLFSGSQPEYSSLFSGIVWFG